MNATTVGGRTYINFVISKICEFLQEPNCIPKGPLHFTKLKEQLYSENSMFFMLIRLYLLLSLKFENCNANQVAAFDTLSS